MQQSQAILECGICEVAHSFFHYLIHQHQLEANGIILGGGGRDGYEALFFLQMKIAINGTIHVIN